MCTLRQLIIADIRKLDEGRIQRNKDTNITSYLPSITIRIADSANFIRTIDANQMNDLHAIYNISDGGNRLGALTHLRYRFGLNPEAAKLMLEKIIAMDFKIQTPVANVETSEEKNYDVMTDEELLLEFKALLKLSHMPYA